MIHYQIDFIFNMSSEGKKTNTLINKYVKMISSIIEMKHQEYSQNKALIGALFKKIKFIITYICINSYIFFYV